MENIRFTRVKRQVTCRYIHKTNLVADFYPEQTIAITDRFFDNGKRQTPFRLLYFLCYIALFKQLNVYLHGYTK